MLRGRDAFSDVESTRQTLDATVANVTDDTPLLPRFDVQLIATLRFKLRRP